ncbi:sugar ABC transporter permease [Marinomonas sp. 15G1-11]|uniref:Sugar ABC transporter permease n=1 Tax=Marinomonas phaeophyticola TaxID=3004091 RepID=A0ABT4JVB8_9GAMM|nr:sugar ABC transporter permease [Marinomonas sp. 15G1-11]MCZ2722335.1 sugar ABC transporter permease [Marinomonas sp. 15G1-11]
MNIKSYPYILIAPSILFLLAFFVYPFIEVFSQAFTTSNGEITLKNFDTIFNDFNFLPSLKNTLLLALVVVPVQLCMAIGMSLMISKMKKGRDTVLYIWTIPLGISDLAAGIIWLALLDQNGFLNSFLFSVGIIDGPESWLNYNNPVAIFAAIVFAEIWRATAILLVILVSGIGLIPKEYYEAAEIFGANAWVRLWKVTLPLLRPSLQTALILRTLLAFEVFAVVMILGGTNMPVLMGEAFNWAFSYRDAGAAAAYAVVILGLSVAFTLFYLKVLHVPKEAQI